MFEIYDKAGNVVDTIKSDRNGRAVSKTLPLSRYTAVSYTHLDVYKRQADNFISQRAGGMRKHTAFSISQNQ